MGDGGSYCGLDREKNVAHNCCGVYVDIFSGCLSCFADSWNLEYILKGGKRLSEEERADQLQCAKALEAIGSGKVSWNPNEIVRLAIKCQIALERDDEPEFCTCGSAAMRTEGPRGFFRCDSCGKPVKGE